MRCKRIPPGKRNRGRYLTGRGVQRSLPTLASIILHEAMTTTVARSKSGCARQSRAELATPGRRHYESIQFDQRRFLY